MGDIRVCINATNECGLDVQFRHKWDCDPWTYWLDYGYNQGNIYCYNITREGEKGWAKLVDDMDGVSWGYRVNDTVGREVIDYDVDVIHVWDDDVNPPEFTLWDYSTWVIFNQPIYVGVTITDASGISSTKLYYDYNNDGVAEGAVDPYEVSHGRYSYKIPEPCPGLTKEQCRDLGRADVYMRFWVTAKDGDNDREGDSAEITMNSMLIFVDPPDQSVQPEEMHEPHIKGYTPGPSEIYVKEGRVARFSIYAEDPDNDKLTYDWQLDGQSVSSETSYVYKPDHTASGTHELVVYVSDGENEVSQDWTVIVIDKICDWELENIETTTTTIKSNDQQEGGGSQGNTQSQSTVGSSGGSGGGGGSSITTTTLETTTTTLVQEPEENTKGTIKVTVNEEKSPMTGEATMVDFKYVLISFAVTILLGLGLLKLLPLLKKKKSSEKKPKPKEKKT